MSALHTSEPIQMSPYQTDLLELIFGVSWKVKARLYKQLATSIGAGLAAARSVELATREMWKPVQRDMQQALASGLPLGKVWARYPACFDEFEVSMIQAGEMSGRLDESLASLASYAEMNEARQKEIITKSAYPILVLHCAVFIPLLPQLVTCCPAAYIKTVLCILLPIYICAALIYLFKRLASMADSLNYAVSRVSRFMPVFGSLQAREAQARFLHCWGKLQSSGLLASQAVPIAARACGNAYYAKRLQKTASSIDAGLKTSEALKALRIFDVQTLSMLETGEETGEFDEMLLKAAEYINSEAAEDRKRLMVIMPTLAMLIVGLIVAWQIIRTFSGLIGDLQSVM